MSGTETNYSIATTGPLILARGRAQTTQLVAERSNARVVPSAATCVLLGHDGTTAVEPTVTIPSDTAQAAYLAGALDALSLAPGYVEQWTLTLGGIVRTARRSVIVSTFELQPPVTQSDLVEGEYPELVDGLGSYTTTLQTFMDRQWEECVRVLFRRGTPPDTVVEPSDIYDWYRHAVLERVFRSMWKDPGDRYHELWLHHQTEAKDRRDSFAALTDRNRDGILDSTDREPIAKQIHPNIPTRTRMPRGFPW